MNFSINIPDAINDYLTLQSINETTDPLYAKRLDQLTHKHTITMAIEFLLKNTSRERLRHDRLSLFAVDLLLK